MPLGFRLVDTRSSRFALAAVWVLSLTAFWLVYLRGLPGGFLFDDIANLKGLQAITSGRLRELLSYSLQGFAGPSGRPLALFTFALQHDSWPGDPAAFKRVNMLIHATNASVLWWFLARLLQLMNVRLGAWIAAAAAALWLLWPIQVSDVLYVVQRMNLLSGTCLFLGLALYTEARLAGLGSQSPSLRANAILLMALAVAIGIGVLFKENAIVFPLLVLAMEATVLSHLRRPPTPWVVALCLPIAAFLVYLFFVLQPWNGYGNRSFDMQQRLLTQGRVLWMYVQQIVLPSVGSLRFLYDNYPVSAGFLTPASTMVSWVAWAGLLIGAWFWRKRWPVAAFAVLFFLASHALESTVLPLELVFEHRNYVGSSAIALLLVLGLVRAAQLSVKMRLALGGLYFAITTFVTFSVASVWGNPQLQKMLWYKQNPDSPRVHMILADSMLSHGHTAEAARILDEATTRFPTHAAMAIARVELGCYHPELRPSSLQTAMAAAATGVDQTMSAVAYLDRIVTAFSENRCQTYTASEIISLLDAAQGNRAFRVRLAADLLLLEGVIYSVLDDTERARAQLHLALALERRPRTLIQAATWELSNGNLAEAGKHIEALLSLKTSKPRQYYASLNDIKVVEKRYDELASAAAQRRE